MPGGAVWNCAEYLKNKLQRARFSIQAKRRQVFPAATIVGYNWYTVDIRPIRDGFLEHAPQGGACRASYFMNKGV